MEEDFTIPKLKEDASRDEKTNRTLNRKYFRVSYQSVLKNILCCRCYFKRETGSAKMQRFLIEKGDKKIERYFDIEELIKTFRLVKVLKYIYLTRL